MKTFRKLNEQLIITFALRERNFIAKVSVTNNLRQRQIVRWNEALCFGYKVCCHYSTIVSYIIEIKSLFISYLLFFLLQLDLCLLKFIGNATVILI